MIINNLLNKVSQGEIQPSGRKLILRVLFVIRLIGEHIFCAKNIKTSSKSP